MEIEDVAKDEIIKNRPRVYMLPQICMDEVSDPELRNLIIKNMYISDWKKITGEIQHYCTKREIPDTVVEDPTKRKVHIYFLIIIICTLIIITSKYNFYYLFYWITCRYNFLFFLDRLSI